MNDPDCRRAVLHLFSKFKPLRWIMAPALGKRPTPPRDEADRLWLTRTDWGASIIHFPSHEVFSFPVRRRDPTSFGHR